MVDESTIRQDIEYQIGTVEAQIGTVGQSVNSTIILTRMSHESTPACSQGGGGYQPTLPDGDLL